MAQVNIGAIKFNWKGPYNNSTAYVVDDVVSSGGSSYVCILASQGNAVSNGTYWQIMSSAGTNGNDADLLSIGSTAQGDLYYNSGSAIARLAKGTAAQELRMNSGATAPEWFTPVAGGDFVKIATGSFSNVGQLNLDGDSIWGANNTYAMHKIVLYNYNPASNSNLLVRQMESGSVINSGNYSWVISSRNSSNTSYSLEAGDGATEMKFTHDNIRAGVLNNICMDIYNMRVTDSSSHLSIIYTSANPNQDGTARLKYNDSAGMTRTTNSINTNRTGLSIYQTAGNITGNYAIYGFKR